MDGRVEIVIVVLVLILALAGGVGVVAARGGWSVPALPGRSGAGGPRPPARVPRRIIDIAPRPAAEPAGPDEAVLSDDGREARPDPPAGERAREREIDLPDDLARLRAALRTDLADAGRAEVQEAVIAQAERLVRLEERLAVEAERLAAGIDGLGRESRARREADEARQEAALERLRAGVLAALAERDRERARERSREGGSAAREWLGQRRAEVGADLYARLARLEAAVAAVTNPILLPGEPYAPPADFLPDALAWENWKDVGERAFAFADAYSAQRLFLDGATRDQVAEFVTTLRGLLTQAIYPNLRPEPTPAQSAALREALVTLAAAVPRVRALFEESTRAQTPGGDGG